ncbi:MAG: MBOAT family protein [Kiritimatiellae bacterium]|nr:MBOAT family protein [Kiritimatiellia bacterium]
MLFPTITFAIFFAIVFALHWTLPERSLARKVVLLLASLFFYAWWSWKFALMLLASAALNHGAALLIDRSSSPAARRRLLVLAITLNLLVLAFFKYAGFLFMGVLHPLAFPICRHFGAVEALFDFEMTVLPFIETIILPIGISFYTFQAIAYVADVASGKSRPAASLLDFANYLAFFPKLCAGPIVRASDLVPQMELLPARSAPIDTGRAATLVLGGLFKKIVIANWIAGHLADPVFTDPGAYGAIDALLGVYGYALQIYCDFSAYSDMAIGCALLLGFHFPDNFNAPYLSSSLQDFWRRWHISLSSWLRDYLYFPLGGSRCPAWKTCRNLILTMLLGGLWHGAGWSYILWGAIHGVGQVLERPFNRKRPKDAPPPPRALTFLRWLVTLHVVTFAWIFFRAGAADAEGLATVRQILLALTRWGTASTLFTPLALIIFALAFLLQFLDADHPRRLWTLFNRLPPILQGLLAAVLITLILGLGPAGVAPFIYFQF